MFKIPWRILRPNQTSMMMLFCENSQMLLTINYFRKEASSYMFDSVLNTPLRYFSSLNNHTCPKSSIKKRDQCAIDQKRVVTRREILRIIHRRRECKYSVNTKL